MQKIPLFILAGIDQGDNFGKKRTGELKFKGKLLLDYLISEAKKSDCFSEIYLVAERETKEKLSENCFLIEAKNNLWKNIKNVFLFAKNKYINNEPLIAILLSDILPSAEEIKDVFLKSEASLDKDLVLTITPSDNLKKRRGKMFIKENEQALAKAYSGTGGLYLLRPDRLDAKLVFTLLSLRMPREVRHIEIDENKIHCDALRSLKGTILLFWLIIRIIFYSLIFIDKMFLFVGIFIKLRKKELTIEKSEYWLSKILVKRKYQSKKKASLKVEIIENPVFVSDIDREEDLKLLEKNS
jgi:CMP-N-acetylneuraminic acid synthetase